LVIERFAANIPSLYGSSGSSLYPCEIFLSASENAMNGKIAFVGGGNMAGALIGGLIADGFPAASVAAVEIDAGRRAQLEREFGIKVSAVVADVVPAADTIVLAVKPQQMRSVANALRSLLSQQLVVSIAAGIRSDDLARWLGGYGRIVRVMPNTPALVRSGVSGLFARAEVSVAERERAQAILNAVGETLWVDSDEMIDAVTAVSGSGPAYVFYFIEAVRQAARELGLSADAAQRMVMGTFAGAIKLAQASSDDVGVLRERVTSKGGTTQYALARMDSGGVAAQVSAAVHAARERAAELGEEFGKAD
jgi:pyrroline-5-carboxylate reductase